MDQAMHISNEVQQITTDLIGWRRHLHQHPELSFTEAETTAYIEQTLHSFGVTAIDKPTKTGLVAHVYGTKSGKQAVVAIRADIDALPMQEDNDLPYASDVPNVMHACGHDGHTAMLLAVAKLLAADPGSFCGEARLIFQHAEELPPGGAIELHKAGVMEDANAILGLHLSSQYPTRVFGIKSGALTANVDRFDITLTGRGGHCALPEECIDPVVLASQLVMALQTVVSRRVAAIDPAVLSVCHLEAGHAYNIIPGSALLSGTVRSFSSKTRAHIEAEIRRITAGLALSAGAEADITWTSGYPAVINDAQLTTLARRAVTERFGKGAALEIDCVTPGEDFSYFEENCPGFFVELGTRDAALGTDAPHHNPRYRMDESALPYGVQYELDMTRALLDGTHKNLPHEEA